MEPIRGRHTACIVTTEQHSIAPKRAWSAARGTTIPTTAQLLLHPKKPLSRPREFLLMSENIEMLEIDSRDNQWDVDIHVMVLCV